MKRKAPIFEREVNPFTGRAQSKVNLKNATNEKDQRAAFAAMKAGVREAQRRTGLGFDGCVLAPAREWVRATVMDAGGKVYEEGGQLYEKGDDHEATYLWPPRTPYSLLWYAYEIHGQLAGIAWERRRGDLAAAMQHAWTLGCIATEMRLEGRHREAAEHGQKMKGLQKSGGPLAAQARHAKAEARNVIWRKKLRQKRAGGMDGTDRAIARNVAIDEYKINPDRPHNSHTGFFFERGCPQCEQAVRKLWDLIYKATRPKKAAPPPRNRS